MGRFERSPFDDTLVEVLINNSGEVSEGADVDVGAEIERVEREEIELLRDRDRRCECFGR